MNCKLLIYGCITGLFMACNTPQHPVSGEKDMTVTVCVNFGEAGNPLEKNIAVKTHTTALEALQYVSTVETHPVGGYVFVTAIDSVQASRGVKAWYYQVNGISPKTLAINNLLHAGDTLTWLYKTDVCSATVDCK